MSSKIFDLVKLGLRRYEQGFNILFETTNVDTQSVLDWSIKHFNQYVPLYKSTYDQLFSVKPSIAEPTAVKTLIIVFLYEFLASIKRSEEFGIAIDRKLRTTIENIIASEESIFIQNPNIPEDFKDSFRFYIFSTFASTREGGKRRKTRRHRVKNKYKT